MGMLHDKIVQQSWNLPLEVFEEPPMSSRKMRPVDYIKSTESPNMMLGQC